MKTIIRFSVLLSVCALLASCGANLSQITIDIPNGGRAVSVSVNPADPSKLIVASETGGLFRSGDGGDTWTQVSGNATFGFNDVLYYPPDPSIIVATAGQDSKTVNGGGVWRSTNGGSSWTHVALTTPDPACSSEMTAYALSFESSQHRMFAATSCGVAFSDDSGASWSFMPVATGYNNDAAFAIASPAAGKIVIITSGGVKVTADGGTSWSTSSSGLPGSFSAGAHTQIAVSPADANHIYFAFNYWKWNAGTSQWDRMNGLYLSKDFGSSWNAIVDQGGWNRPPFVKLTKTIAGSPVKYNLYYCDGGCQLRKTQVTHSANPTLGAWTDLTVDHCDASDFGFGADGIAPLILLGDGGLHKSTDGGIHWTMSGAGKKGYNALQITEVTGQLHSSDDKADLYFATQDNNLFASPDLGNTWPASRCCEGFFMNIVRQSLSAADTKLTGVSCWTCGNFISSPVLAGQGAFPNPPNDNGNPFLLSPGSYIQNTKLSGLNATVVNLTTDTGGSWVSRYGYSEEPQDLSKKSGDAANPIVFTAVRYPGVTSDGNAIVRIKRIIDVLGSGSPVVSDITGFGSLGIFATMFAWYKPYGVDPKDPNHIILADITDDNMKVTHDGGAHWTNDDNLKKMITDNGNFKFRVGPFTQVSCYGFDPECANHILVGTVQAGVVQSHDAGATWERVLGTDVIPYVSAFFFPGGYKAVISSYGRSLWQLKYEDCPSIKIKNPNLVAEEPLIKWKGAYVPISQIHDPDVCPVCGFILISGGEITEILTDQSGSQIKEVAISSGELKFYSWDKKEMPLPFKVTLSKSAGTFQFDPELPSLLKQNKGSKIVGLYVEGNLYKGALIAREPLRPDQLPSRKVLPPSINLGLPETGHISIKDNKGLRFVVRGFDARQQIEVEIDGHPIDVTQYNQQAADKNGNITLELKTPFSVGAHKILVRQRIGDRLIQDVSLFHVTPVDEPNKR
jgi:hypothetical protein